MQASFQQYSAYILHYRGRDGRHDEMPEKTPGFIQDGAYIQDNSTDSINDAEWPVQGNCVGFPSAISEQAEYTFKQRSQKTAYHEQPEQRRIFK